MRSVKMVTWTPWTKWNELICFLGLIMKSPSSGFLLEHFWNINPDASDVFWKIAAWELSCVYVYDTWLKIEKRGKRKRTFLLARYSIPAAMSVENRSSCCDGIVELLYPLWVRRLLRKNVRKVPLAASSIATYRNPEIICAISDYSFLFLYAMNTFMCYNSRLFMLHLSVFCFCHYLLFVFDENKILICNLKEKVLLSLFHQNKAFLRGGR